MEEAPISARTPIATALKGDPGALDRLADLHVFFGRFRGALMRHTMGRLLTLGDAARLTGLAPDQVVAAARALAPTACSSPDPSPPPSTAGTPTWVASQDAASVTTFDARPYLDHGKDPLTDILDLAATIPPHGVLVVDAPFDPLPLRRVLGNRGFSAFADRIADDHWRVYFRRDGRGGEPQSVVPGTVDGARIWNEDGAAHIDVRGLVPPEPMLAIIELIERPATGCQVIVHHEREPAYLYPELAERGWAWEILAGEPGEVRLRLYRLARERAS